MGKQNEKKDSNLCVVGLCVLLFFSDAIELFARLFHLALSAAFFLFAVPGPRISPSGEVVGAAGEHGTDGIGKPLVAFVEFALAALVATEERA